MKYVKQSLTTLLMLFLAIPAMAQTTITLTPAQVQHVLQDNQQPPNDPPAGQCQNSHAQGTIHKWEHVFYQPFPHPVTQDVVNQVVPLNGYYALEFHTGNYSDDGKLTLLENASTPGIRYGSISECKGDFNVSQFCKHTWGLGGGMRWATNNRHNSCHLKKNTTYYFNVSFRDGGIGHTNCVGSPCRINIQHVNL